MFAVNKFIFPLFVTVIVIAFFVVLCRHTFNVVFCFQYQMIYDNMPTFLTMYTCQRVKSVLTAGGSIVTTKTTLTTGRA